MTNEQTIPSAHIALDEGDHTYSIYINDQRALQLNHQRYINDLIRNLRLHPQHGAAYRDFAVNREIAVKIEPQVFLGLIEQIPIAAEDQPVVENLFKYLIGDSGLEHQDIKRYIDHTSHDVTNQWVETLKTPDDEGGTPSIELRVKRFAEYYSDGIYIAAIPK